MSVKKKIDIHIHTIAFKGIERFGGGTYATPEEIRKMYKKLGISKGVILPEVNPDCAFQIQSNEEAHYLTQKYPDLFYWFAILIPKMEGTDQILICHISEHYKKLGAKGVGEITANMYFDDPYGKSFYHAQVRDACIIYIGPTIGGCYGLVDELDFRDSKRNWLNFLSLYL